MITAGSPGSSTAGSSAAVSSTAGSSGDHGRVVVGVEDAPQSRAALQWAIAHAQRVGARVHAVTAWAPTPHLTAGPELGSGVTMIDPLTDGQLQAAAQERLREVLATLPPGTEQLVDRSAVPGDPATVLIDASRDADLLVLGNAGRGALAAAVTGSVAARCAHHATCPVVLVPDPERCE